MKEKLTIRNIDGQEKEYDILFTFEFNRTKKKYVAYTDYSKGDDGNMNCYSYILEDTKLLPIETEEEIKVVERLLQTITESTKLKYQMISSSGGVL